MKFDLRKAIEQVALNEQKKEALEEQKITMPKIRKVGNMNIGITFKHPNTLYSIRFRKEEFFIAPSEIKDLIKILSQRDIVTKNPAGMESLPEENNINEGTEKMSSRDIENIIRKNKLKGSALPMFKVMGGKMVHMPFKSEIQSIGKPQMIRGTSPEDAAKTYTKMYKNPVMSVELDDDDWVNANKGK